MADSEFITRADVERVRKSMETVISEINQKDYSPTNTMMSNVYQVAYEMLGHLLDPSLDEGGWFLPHRFYE